MKRNLVLMGFLLLSATLHAAPENGGAIGFEANAIRWRLLSAESDAYICAVCKSRLYFLGSFDGVSAEERALGREAAAAFARIESTGVYPAAGREHFQAEWLFLLQNLSRESWLAGAEFGPQASPVEAKLNPSSEDPFVRALLARGKTLTPAFFGGDPKKGLKLLETLRGEHPADPLVRLFYAEALRENGFRNEARAIAADVLRADPRNDFAAYLAE
jgi:hypothetical protein